MYVKIILMFFWLLFISRNVEAQNNYQRIFDIPVTEFNNPLKYPWTGGLNTPQFYEMDLDGDNIQDLFIFDRTGNVVLTFLYKQNNYKFTTAYKDIFPAMQHWVVVADYNCDGVADLFTANNTFISLYKGIRTGSDLSFSLIEDTLKYKDGPNIRPISVLQIDIPAVIDVNNDGDLDILTFSPGGGYMYYFESQSKETNGSCGFATFLLEDECWGNFYESGLTKTVDLDSCGTGRVAGNGLQNNPTRHAGSTVLALDLNGDGLKEAVLGDISFNNLNLLINGGTLADAEITSQDINFPSNTKPVELPIFPAAFYLDVNKDGKKDLLVSPNSVNNSVDVQNVWYYQNTGTAQAPVFQFVENDFLVGEMIDVGTGSAPVFFDYNRDGLMDIIIGNESKQFGATELSARLVLYLNTGTLAEPSYNLTDTNVFNLEQFGLFSIYPAFGDLDGDGDEDMIIGDFDGKLHFFENKSTTGSSFPTITANYFNIDVGSMATPQIVDVNKDGKLDLLVGERNGNLNYFQNTGTTAIPQFSATPTNDFFGKVDVRPQFSPVGNSVPYLFTPQPGQPYQLLVGNLDGKVIRYDNIEGNLGGTFTKTDSTFFDMDFGERAAISGRDINNDQKPEILIGNSRGGVLLYSRDIVASVEHKLNQPEEQVIIYPVPAKEHISVLFKSEKTDSFNLSIYDLSGRRYITKELSKNEINNLFIGDLSNGVYLAVFEDSGLKTIKLFIIQR